MSATRYVPSIQISILFFHHFLFFFDNWSLINVHVSFYYVYNNHSIGGQRMALACRELLHGCDNRDKKRLELLLVLSYQFVSFSFISCSYVYVGAILLFILSIFCPPNLYFYTKNMIFKIIKSRVFIYIYIIELQECDAIF